MELVLRVNLGPLNVLKGLINEVLKLTNCIYIPYICMYVVYLSCDFIYWNTESCKDLFKMLNSLTVIEIVTD